MKLANVKKICTTSLLLLGMISVLGGCGNSGNSDFTKEEKREIDDAFSADERKELEAEFGGGDFDGGSSKKTTKYDETITIDPFEDVTVIISGEAPYNSNFTIEKPESEHEYVSKIYIDIADDVDKKSIFAGNTVKVTAKYLLDDKEKFEKKLQKNIEFSRETAEIEVIADPENYYHMFAKWDDLSGEYKTELMTYASENIEKLTDDNYWDLFDTDDHDVSYGSHSESYTISEPLGIYWCFTKENIRPTSNYVAISFDVTDSTNYTRTVYFTVEDLLINGNTGEFTWTDMPKGVFSVKQGLNNLAEIDENRDYSQYTSYFPIGADENMIAEYISLTE